jgi:hypothetical protein
LVLDSPALLAVEVDSLVKRSSQHRASANQLGLARLEEPELAQAYLELQVAPVGSAKLNNPKEVFLAPNNLNNPMHLDSNRKLECLAPNLSNQAKAIASSGTKPRDSTNLQDSRRKLLLVRQRSNPRWEAQVARSGAEQAYSVKLKCNLNSNLNKPSDLAWEVVGSSDSSNSRASQHLELRHKLRPT